MTDYALAFYLVNEQSSHDYEPLWTESTRRSPYSVFSLAHQRQQYRQGPLAASAQIPGCECERSRCSSLSEAGFLTSTVARGRQKSRPTDGPTPPARRTRLLGVDRCEQLLHGAR